jgi:hypothetical protein
MLPLVVVLRTWGVLMLGVLTFSREWRLSAAVAHAERLGCDVLHASRTAPNAGVIVDVRMSLDAANRVAFAVAKREMRFRKAADVGRAAN